jgi:hypothetical protein
VHKGAMQQPRYGFAVGSGERGEVDGFAHGSEDFPAFAIALLDARTGCRQPVALLLVSICFLGDPRKGRFAFYAGFIGHSFRRWH